MHTGLTVTLTWEYCMVLCVLNFLLLQILGKTIFMATSYTHAILSPNSVCFHFMWCTLIVYPPFSLLLLFFYVLKSWSQSTTMISWLFKSIQPIVWNTGVVENYSYGVRELWFQILLVWPFTNYMILNNQQDSGFLTIIIRTLFCWA